MTSLAEAANLPREGTKSERLTLVYDTETSGFALFNRPPNDPGQPHLVQLGASLIEEDGTERASLNMIVKPDGWVIPDKVAEIHGISTALATRVGLPLRVVVAAFCQLRSLADVVVAHNEPFDWLVLEAQIARLGVVPAKGWPDRLCTMRGSAALVNLPPTPKMIKAGYTKNKPPNLTELHTFLFGVGFEGAHDAMVDVRACGRCFVELRKRGVL